MLLVSEQLLVGWKSWLCWSCNSHCLHCNQEFATDLYQHEMKLRLQDIVWDLTNQNQTASLRPSYKQICSFFWVLHGNAKCQPLRRLPFRKPGKPCFKNWPSEWNKCIENAASFFLHGSSIMNSCHLPTCKLTKVLHGSNITNSGHLPTCKLNKRRVKLEVTIDKKSASSISACVNWLCRAYPLPLVGGIPPWYKWRNNFFVDCRRKEMLYWTSNFLDMARQIFPLEHMHFFEMFTKDYCMC